MSIKIIKAAAIFLEGKLVKNLAIAVNMHTGNIEKIDAEEKLGKEYNDALKEDWGGLVIVPGSINAHNHSFQSLLRGIAADRPFLEWRDNSLYKFSPRMRLQDIYTGALFAFTEMLKCGATTVADFFYLHQFGSESDEAVIQAAKDCGIRLVLARTMYDWQGAPSGYVEDVQTAVNRTESLMKKYTGGMVKVLPAPHSLHAASPEMIKAGYHLAQKYNSPYHIHVAEEMFEVEQVKKEHNGMTPLRYLDYLGVVDAHMSIIHGVWLNEDEVKIMGQKGAHLIYCPSSNMFLADGITNIPAYMAAAVPIALGSDGACGNNRISVFEEMRMVSILQKAETCNALCVNFHDAFKMGTENGGTVLDLPVGKITVGCKADFVGISVQDFSMQPLTKKGQQFLPNLVYSMQPTAIKRVAVNGKTTVMQGKLVNIAEERILEEIGKTMEHLEAV
ncbi:amidohydrolase family protein [Pectinatus cerevisiiphilus]|uniref:5-methylthioadenosine/S-adenosylhomocysteine deaminase n=1 Tax=Pectinatus cerevisiiphilus TaxID=86956 RepID=A0A4R3K903_9FIRM|nr:amidohydrolase family protein [Pectinatus cerevisiiphilus]TCS79313.1 5-methylthioadenosine/S-adenosylhomocysteine deaminase [Pectinatus cerevisiiphilus]